MEVGTRGMSQRNLGVFTLKLTHHLSVGVDLLQAVLEELELSRDHWPARQDLVVDLIHLPVEQLHFWVNGATDLVAIDIQCYVLTGQKAETTQQD